MPGSSVTEAALTFSVDRRNPSLYGESIHGVRGCPTIHLSRESFVAGSHGKEASDRVSMDSARSSQHLDLLTVLPYRLCRGRVGDLPRGPAPGTGHRSDAPGCARGAGRRADW